MTRYVRAVLGLDACLVKDLVVYALPVQALTHLLHGKEAVDRLVGDDGDALGGQVLEVHAHLLGGAEAEADRRGGHLEGILLLGCYVGRDRVVSPRRPAGTRDDGGEAIAVAAGVGMAWTRGRVGELDRPQETRGSLGRLVFGALAIAGGVARVVLQWERP